MVQAPRFNGHQGLSAKCLGHQALPQCVFQAARIKAKPFGWPAASLDTTSLKRTRKYQIPKSEPLLA
jgi:hypothetical protein